MSYHSDSLTITIDVLKSTSKMAKRSAEQSIDLTNNYLKKYRKILPKPANDFSKETLPNKTHNQVANQDNNMNNLIVLFDGFKIMPFESYQKTQYEIININLIEEEEDDDDEKDELRRQLFSSEEELIIDFHQDEIGDQIITSTNYSTEEDNYAENNQFCDISTQELLDLFNSD